MRNFIRNHKIMLLFVLIFGYLLSPVAIAVDVQDIDTTKNYMIVEAGSSTDIDFDVLYDN